MKGIDTFREMLRKAKKSQIKHRTKGDISPRQEKKNHKRGIDLDKLEETLIKLSEKEYKTYFKKRFHGEFKNFLEMKKYLKHAINRAKSKN